IKILSETGFQPLGFADVDDLPVLDQHHIYAGILRHVFELRLKVHGDIIPHRALLVKRRACPCGYALFTCSLLCADEWGRMMAETHHASLRRRRLPSCCVALTATVRARGGSLLRVGVAGDERRSRHRE